MKKWTIILLIFTLFCLPSIRAHAEHPSELKLKSKAAVLVDSQSGVILYNKNGSKKMYPASLTKIATAIYAIEKGSLDDKVTVSKNAVEVEGTRVYLNEAEVVTLKKLLQGMLINSGNDAAYAIAEHLDGKMEQFEYNLNQYLTEKIGVKNTHFTNPHGLYDKNHYTTAEDLARITNYAYKNPVFKKIFGTKELKWHGQSWDTVLYTHHQMLKGEVPFEGVTGGKTGFVDQSKQTLATTAENDHIKLTAIVLKTDFKRDIYNDTVSLINYGFQHYKTTHLDKDSIFYFKKNKYSLSNETFYTEPIEGSIQKIDADGKLTIKNFKGETLQAIQLDPVMEAVDQPQKPNESPKKHIDKVNMNGFYAIAALIMVMFVIGIRKRVVR